MANDENIPRHKARREDLPAMTPLKGCDYKTSRGKDALKLQRLCEDGDVFIGSAAERLKRSTRYVRSIAEEFDFEVIRFPGRVSGWLIGRAT